MFALLRIGEVMSHCYYLKKVSHVGWDGKKEEIERTTDRKEKANTNEGRC